MIYNKPLLNDCRPKNKFERIFNDNLLSNKMPNNSFEKVLSNRNCFGYK